MAVYDNEVDTQRPCPISGSHKALVVCERDRHKKSLRNVINKESGLIYVDPVPFKNTEKFYQNEYRKSYKGVLTPKSKHVYRAGGVALRRYSRIKNLINPTSVCLDAGSSSGEFVYLMGKRGHDTQGVEANLPYAEYSQAEFKIPVTICPFSQFHSKKRFDLITMFHVLEHLENPIKDLKHLGKYLKPKGRFIIEVPNILYPNMSFSNKWHPGHLFSYTKDTLPLVMKVAGFDLVKCNTLEDGGNLWGEFAKSNYEHGERICQADGQAIIKELYDKKLNYYLRMGNFLKFIPKIISQLQEYLKAKNKRGSIILDELYH